jgi:hypothetical protein
MVTRYEDLQEAIEYTNRLIRALGGRVGIKLGRRYGYYALDLIDLSTGSMLDTLISWLNRGDVENILIALNRVLGQIERSRMGEGYMPLP